MATKTTLQSMKSSGANEPSSQLPEIVNVIRQQQQYSIVMANHHQYHQYSVAFLLSSPGLIWEKFLSISATQSLIYLVNSVRLSVCFPLALAFNDWCEIAHCKLAVQWVEDWGRHRREELFIQQHFNWFRFERTRWLPPGSSYSTSFDDLGRNRVSPKLAWINWQPEEITEFRQLEWMMGLICGREIFLTRNTSSGGRRTGVCVIPCVGQWASQI